MITESFEKKLIRRIRALNAPLDPLPAKLAPRIERIGGLRAVLFDVYGTLLVSGAGKNPADNRAAQAAALRKALAAVGGKMCAPAAREGIRLFNAMIAREHAGLKRSGTRHPEVDIMALWKKVLAELRSRALIKLDLGEESAALVAVEYENRVNPVWPMPGAVKILAELSARGFLLGIVSNAQFYTRLTLSAFFGPEWQRWFRPELCFWSHEYGQAKPGRFLYRRAARELNKCRAARPSEVIMIGNDFAHDVRPAMDCGFRAVLFAGDRRSCRPGHTPRRAPQACLTITRWRQLLEIVGPAPQRP